MGADLLVAEPGHHPGDPSDLSRSAPPDHREVGPAPSTTLPAAARCPCCAESNPDHARFCLGCGRALAAPPAAARRLITALYCDVVDSTGLAERLDVEALHVALDAFFTTVTAAVQAQRGRVEKYAGDSVLAIFGLPHAAEDDASRAVMAALDVQRALRDVGTRLHARLGIGLDARIGVATGEVAVLGTMAGESLSVVGDVTNVAARLEGTARPGEVRLTETTRQLVRASILTEPVGELRLRGRTSGVTAHRALRPRWPQDLQRGDPPCELVGRADEVRAVEAAIASAHGRGTGHLVVVRGEAGIGKSALVDHVVQRHAERVTVLRSSCRPRSCAGPLDPIRDLVSTAMRYHPSIDAELPDDRRAALGDLTSHPGPNASIGVLARAVSHVMALAATARPLLIVAEDLHLADAAVTAILDHVMQAAARLPICLLTSCRHDLDRVLPGDARHKTVITLGALDPTESTQLLHRALRDHAATNLDIAELARRADGNPMFSLELAREAADLGRIPERAPATIRSLVAANLDRLPPRDRRTLVAAAVVGERFTPRELTEALGAAALPDLDQLAMRGLIVPDGSAWRFVHGLVRDETYHQTPRLARAEIHERLARHAARIGDTRSAIHHHAAARSSRRTVGASDSAVIEPIGRPQQALAPVG